MATRARSTKGPGSARVTKKKAKKKAATARRRQGYTLHIISDATGMLARHLINTVLTQFPALRIRQVYHTFVETDEDIDGVMASIERGRTLVLFGILNPEHKQRIFQSCTARSIPCFDVSGSLVQFIADHTGTAPVNELSRLHETDAGYFQRIAAMEFTAQHDDSRRIETIDQADIVIVGLSRVSKSPTSTYLGSMGYKVANVSVTRQTGFPRELNKVRKRTVAFTCTPDQIYQTRSRRFKDFTRAIEDQGLGELGYTNRRAVVEEVVFAEHEYRKRGYPIIDITGKTVEELSVTVLRELDIPSRNNIEYDA